jgi:aminopeptidase N
MSLIDDTLAVKSNLLGAAADWIRFEAAVGTAPDQIAVAPGYLTREWTDGGRRWFHYQMDVPMIHFYSIVSARYAVKQDTWQAPDGRTINLEIYHHPSHTWNLDRMMDGMKQSLAYYTEAFGPYQHRQVRILEFPRYAGFAQSFANTIPYSESVGFIADVGKNDVDYPFYITCHEVAHQWWAHQVVGGKVQGFQFLSETMSQYASLMVMEKNFGKENMDKFLELEMQNYLQGRTGERIAETPVLLSENQPYIHYNKGSVVMYALQDYLGEDTLNAALKRYVSKVKFQEPPYTTTREWMQYVSAVTPDSLRGVLTDLLETITLYENTADSATYVEQDGRYKVSFTVKSRKLRMIHDDESEVPINDYIDIGVFGQEKQDGKWVDKVLYLQKHKITTPEQRIEVWVDAKPEKAGIDPWHKLVDRKPADNTAITRPAKIP